MPKKNYDPQRLLRRHHSVKISVEVDEALALAIEAKINGPDGLEQNGHETAKECLERLAQDYVSAGFKALREEGKKAELAKARAEVRRLEEEMGIPSRDAPECICAADADACPIHGHGVGEQGGAV